MCPNHQAPLHGMMKQQRTQYYLILANLPHSVIQQPRTEDWKLVKDIIYHRSLKPNGLDRNFGKCDIFPAFGLALCDFNDPDWRQIAYNDIQGFYWRGVHLKAWLCEKKGNRMEQSAGPIDPVTGRILPAPVYRIDIGPTLVRCLGCVPFGMAAPPVGMMYPYPASPAAFQVPHNPYLSVGFSQMQQMYADEQLMRDQSAAMLPALSDGSSSSSSSTTSTNYRASDTSSHDALPRRSKGYGSSWQDVTTPDSSIASGNTMHGTYPARSRAKDTPNSHETCKKIEIRGFDPTVDPATFQPALEEASGIQITNLKLCKGSSRRRARMFASFRNEHDAGQAVRSLNGQTVAGCRLDVIFDRQGYRGRAPRGGFDAVGNRYLSSGYPTAEPRMHDLVLPAIGGDQYGHKPERKGPVIINGSVD